MPKFKYRALNANGKTIEDYFNAESRKEALEKLIRRGLQPLQLEPVSREGFPQNVQRKLFKGTHSSDRQSKLSHKIALPFLKRILQLHGSGMPIGDTLKILQTRLRDESQKELAIALWRELSEGKGLAEALKKYPKVFGEDIIYPIEAAEVTGNLSPVLKEVIRLLTERERLKKKVLAGMAYPVFVSVVAIFVVGFFLFFLLPRIERMLTALGGHLTLPARLLIGFSHSLVYGLPLMCVMVIVVWFSLIEWRKRSNHGHLRTDAWTLKFPFIGNLVRYVEICRVSNLMSTLLGSGVNLTEAMRLTEKAIHNLYLRQLFQEARSKINDGIALPIAFKSREIPFFTDLALDILTVGENTGNLHESLQEIYLLHNEEVDTRLRWLTNFITSFALGFAFFLVGVLALGIVSSIMQFSNSLKF